MFEVKVVEPESLDLDVYAGLQKAAFADIMEERKASTDFMTPEYYRWKYNPPAGPAKIALVYHGSRPVAANAMFPLEIRFGKRRYRGYQSCDTATLPSSRGRGLFFQCLNALLDILDADDLFFGFPNANSIGGFVKIGWRKIAEIRTWVKPLLLFSGRTAKGIFPVETFGDPMDRLNRQMLESGRVVLEKSSDYMQWRYAERPGAPYLFLAAGTPSDWKGFSVYREASVLGKRWSVVMEFYADTIFVADRLLCEIARRSKANGIDRIIVLHSDFNAASGILKGFLPIPHVLLPRRQILMGSGGSGLIDRAWRVTTGDWDVF